jgi:hypothetical protein
VTESVVLRQGFAIDLLFHFTIASVGLRSRTMFTAKGNFQPAKYRWLT